MPQLYASTLLLFCSVTGLLLVVIATTARATSRVELASWPTPDEGRYSYKCCTRLLSRTTIEESESVVRCSNHACIKINLHRYLAGDDCCWSENVVQNRSVYEYVVNETSCDEESNVVHFPATFEFPTDQRGGEGVANNGSQFDRSDTTTKTTYPNLIECRWVWQFDEKTRVELEFDRFSLEDDRIDQCMDDDCCLNDYAEVTFTKGKNRGSRLRRYCGEDVPPIQKRHKVRRVEVRVVTDGSDVKSGFSGTLKKI